MTERQKFDLVNRIGNLEIRRYHPCVMADVIVDASYNNAANMGFRPLVTYISQN
ncbi:MAG: heme-binding protein, partial [Actinomycetota bacterium]